MPPPALPVVQSFILCDYSSVDTAGKVSLCGCFDSFSNAAFPAMFRCSLHAVLVDGYGKTPVVIELVDLSTSAKVVVASGECDFKNPLRPCSLTIQMTPTFTKPGTYAFELSSGGHVFGTRRFEVLHTAQGIAPVL
jgi:hypothetical protein